VTAKGARNEAACLAPHGSSRGAKPVTCGEEGPRSPRSRASTRSGRAIQRMTCWRRCASMKTPSPRGVRRPARACHDRRVDQNRGRSIASRPLRRAGVARRGTGRRGTQELGDGRAGPVDAGDQLVRKRLIAVDGAGIQPQAAGPRGRAPPVTAQPHKIAGQRLDPEPRRDRRDHHDRRERHVRDPVRQDAELSPTAAPPLVAVAERDQPGASCSQRK
jgi:hypothetical protein